MTQKTGTKERAISVRFCSHRLDKMSNCVAREMGRGVESGFVTDEGLAHTHAPVPAALGLRIYAINTSN